MMQHDNDPQPTGTLLDDARLHDALAAADSGVADPHAPAEPLPPRAVPG